MANGLLVSFLGPFPGSCHDLTMVRDISLMGQTTTDMLKNSVPSGFSVYGDPAYIQGDAISRPLPNDKVRNKQMKMMEKVRNKHTVRR